MKPPPVGHQFRSVVLNLLSLTFVLGLIASAAQNRLHGGLSTGARTPEGIERIRKAVTKHGYYSEAARRERRELLREQVER